MSQAVATDTYFDEVDQMTVGQKIKNFPYQLATLIMYSFREAASAGVPDLRVPASEKPSPGN